MGVIYVKLKIVVILVLFVGIALFGVFANKVFFVSQSALGPGNIEAGNPYNAAAEIAQALEKMKKGQEKAAIITGGRGGQRQIALTFDGLADRTTMQRILDLLKKYNIQATFFADGLQIAEEPQTVANIKKEGFKIENYTLLGLGKMEALPVERLIADFCRAAKIIQVNTDQGPNLLKCNDTSYTDQVLLVAKACGFRSVVKSDVFINIKQINAVNGADTFVKAIKPGSIVSVKLKANTEPIIPEQEKTDLRPAIDKQPGLKDLQTKVDMEEKELIEALEKFLLALQKAKYTTINVEDIPQSDTKTAFLPSKGNNSMFFSKLVSLMQEQIAAFAGCRPVYAAEAKTQAATELKMIFTTEPALAYTFGGLSKETAVNDVLTRLKLLGIKATFFVSEIEMKRHPQVLRQIIEEGHEVGIAIRPKDGETFDETSKIITRSRNILETQFGVSTNLVKQSSGAVSDITKEVVGSLNCKLIGQSMNIVQSKHKEYTSADQVMPEIFGKSVFSLSRGQILYFRMDFYTNEKLVGDLLETIKQRKVDNIAYITSFDNPISNSANNSQYRIKPVGQLLANTQYHYQYPVDPQKAPDKLRPNAPKLNIDSSNFIHEASKRYIGHINVNYEDRVIGFSKMEERRLDKNGFIHTNENVVFLTFDDWGTDASINKLLYVLRKHQVSGTFFVLTNNVLANPNLLRTIALEGHEIGSHSDKHKPMAVPDPKTGKYVPTMNKEEYTKDLTTAYQKLFDVTGDVTIRGKSSLTRFFRPPQLAISKMGFETLFETGYEYIVAGSTSTNDYKAKDITELIEIIKDGVYTKDGEVQKGAILVLHVGDGSVYTAMAVDILLTANAAKSDLDPTKFKVGRLSDYLVDGYSQIDRKKSLKLTSQEKFRGKESQL